jgi:hypothetical protein
MYAQADANVRRGYRLHISNLEDRAFTYTVKYWVTPPTNEPRWAAALNLFFTFYDEDSVAFRRTGGVYMAAMTFVVEAKHTVSVGITPNLNFAGVEGFKLLKGYVTLELPVLRNTPDNPYFRSVPQADVPVKVLLNPETTMVHMDTSGRGMTQNMDGVVTGRVSVTRLNFDTVEPLIPASGKAENEVTPNGIHLLSHDALVNALKLSRATEERSFGTESLSPAERMGTLIELLCDLDTQEEFVAELNGVLGENRAAARICRGS